MQLDLTTRNAILSTIADRIKTGNTFSNPIILVYGGTMPASPNVPTNELPLITINLTPQAFLTPINGKMSAIQMSAPAVINRGICKWYRIYNRNGESIADGPVSLFNKPGELWLSQTTVVPGMTVHADHKTISI